MQSRKTVPSFSRRLRKFAAAAALALLFSGRVGASVDYLWQANDGSGNLSGSWNDPADWSPAGPASGQDDTADFSQQNITATSTVTLDANQTIGNIIFGDTDDTSAGNWVVTPGAGSYTLTLVTSSGLPTLTVSALGSGSYAEITAPIAGSQGFIKSGVGELILGSGSSDTVANTYTGTTFISAGTLLLNKASGTNAITGNAVINGGILELAQANQIASTSNLILTSGAFEANGNNQTVALLEITGGNFQTIGTNINASNTITVSGLTTLSGGTLSLNSTNTGSGTTLSTNSMLMTGGNTLFGTASGGVQKLVIGSGGITLINPVTIAIAAGATGTGGGDLQLNGDLTAVAVPSGTVGQSITGPASNSASVGGVVDLNNGTHTFYVEDGAPVVDLDISAVIGTNGTTGSGYYPTPVGNPGSLTKAGSGTLQLDPYFQDNFAGNLTVNAGTLVLAFTHLSNPLDLVTSNSLILGGGTLSILADPAAGVKTYQSFQGTSLTLNAGGSGITINPNGGGGVMLTLPNTWTRQTGATLSFNLSAGNANVISSPAISDGIIPYATVQDTTGAGFATVSSGDIVRYNSATVLSGPSNAGLSSTTNYSVDLPSGTTSTTLGGSANSLQVTAAANSTVAFGGSNFTISSGGLLATGGPGLQITLSNGTLTSYGVNYELTLHQDEASGGILYLSSSLSFYGGTILTLDGSNGAAVAFQNGSSTFDGGVQLNAGAVAVPTVSSNKVGGGLSSGPFGTGTITIAGGELRSTTNANTEIDNPINLQTDLIIPSAGADETLTLGGEITLLGNNTIYQNSTAPVILSGQIRMQGNPGQTYSLTLAGTGTLVLGGPSEDIGNLYVDSGRLLVNGSAVGSINELTGVRGGTLAGTGVIGSSVTVYPSGTISAGDGLTAPGLLTLNGSGNVFADGSRYLWKINDATGTAGSSDGWDELNLASLSVGTTAGVDVYPSAVGAGNTIANFNANRSYRFPIAFLQLSNSSALLANFHLDTTGLSAFASSVGVSASSFSLGLAPDSFYPNEDDLVINYVPAPEPGSLALAGIAACGFLIRRRKSKTN